MDNDKQTTEELLDVIDLREAELDDAVIQCLMDFSENIGYEPEIENIISDVKEMICEYLYREHGVSVYRPMFLETADGGEVYYDYPYPEIDFS